MPNQCRLLVYGRSWRCSIKCSNAADSVGPGCKGLLCLCCSRCAEQGALGVCNHKLAAIDNPSTFCSTLFLYAFAQRMLVHAADIQRDCQLCICTSQLPFTPHHYMLLTESCYAAALFSWDSISNLTVVKRVNKRTRKPASRPAPGPKVPEPAGTSEWLKGTNYGQETRSRVKRENSRSKLSSSAPTSPQ